MTVTSLFISQQDIFNALSLNQKSLILAIFAFLFISVAFGVVEYVLNGRFFRRWSIEATEALKSVNRKRLEGKYGTVGAMQVDYQGSIDKIPNKTTNIFLALQLVAISVGGVSFVVLLASVMYKGIF